MTSTTTSSSSSSVAMEQSIIPNSSSSPPPQSIDTLTIPKKPQRPLTAYHIFLQIEREYIIQTIDGDADADQSVMMENKILHDNVPQRYKNIKLMPDWYAGPSKRTKKRKHRKQHGKIGFLELSKTISKRWSQLDQVDPETKSFVQKIAKSEVAEYYKEMNEYKELIKDLPPSLLPPKAKKKKKEKKTIKKRTMEEEQQQVAGGSDTSSSLELEQQGCSKKMKTFHLQEEEESSTPLSTSTDSESTVTPKKMKNSKKNFVRRVTMTIDNTDSITETFDSFKNDQPLDFDDLFCQPIGNSQPIGVEVMMGMDMNEDPGLQHSISSGSLSTMSRSYPNEGRSSPLAEVDLCDDEILKLWESSISDEEEELDMDSVLIDLCI